MRKYLQQRYWINMPEPIILNLLSWTYYPEPIILNHIQHFFLTRVSKRFFFIPDAAVSSKNNVELRMANHHFLHNGDATPSPQPIILFVVESSLSSSS